MLDEERIRKQYQEHLEEFERIRREVQQSLSNVAQAFYQKTRFSVIIPPPRLKEIDSVLKKMKKKGIISNSLFDQDGDNLSLVVNDFLGARILCNTREDVEEISVIIQQRPRFTLIKMEKLEKDSGYRALHLDMQYDTFWQDMRIFTPLELQIKTHLQNAWAEITHDESYKPENEDLKNDWERMYSRHMADILDKLDDMASTIRMQRVSYVNPPTTIDDSITLINDKTLSYKIDALKGHERLTQQEMSLVLGRLKEEGFVILAEVADLLRDEQVQSKIKKVKEELEDKKNVTAFEMLYYGSLLKRGKTERFEEEIRDDYGFVQEQCIECDKFLTREEFVFINEETDSDIDYYCTAHRSDKFTNECPRCGILTSGELCKKCEADMVNF